MNPHLIYEPYRQLVRSLCDGNPNLYYLEEFMGERHSRNCRVAVLDFGVESNDIVKCVKSTFAPGCRTNAEHFLSDFSSDRFPHRRLFIVEDLTAEVIEALGYKFNIDPAFFAGHVRLTEGDTIEGKSSTPKLPSLCDPHKELHLKYWEIFGPGGDIEESKASGEKRDVKSSNVHRKVWLRPSHEPKDDKELHLALVRRKASYWARTYEDIDEGSWDAVILVDPPYEYLCRRHHRHHQSPHYCRPESFRNGYIDFTPWSKSLVITDRPPSNPPRTSIFDDIIYYTMEEWPLSTLGVDPGDATIFLRKIVVSIWMVSIEFLKRDYSNVQLDEIDFKPLDNNAIERKLRNLHGATSLATRFWTHTRQNLFSLGIAPREGSFYVRYPEGRILDEKAGRKRCHHRSQNLHQWELEDDEVDWIYIFNELETWRKKYASLTKIQLQSLDIYNTQEEGEQNRHVQLITWLGAIFLPVNLVSSIFSMGNGWGPGESKFWAYWTIVVPIIPMSALLLEACRPNSWTSERINDLRNLWKHKTK